MLGDIDEAADADGRVDEEARRRGAGAAEFALEQIVGQDDRGLQVAQEVAHAVFGRIGQRQVIPAGERLQQDFVEELIDLEEISVHRLERIVGLVIGLDRCFVGGVGLGRATGREHGEAQHRCDHRDAKP